MIMGIILESKYIKRDIFFNKKLFSFSENNINEINSQIIDGYKAILVDAKNVEGGDFIFYDKNKIIQVDDTESFFNDEYKSSELDGLTKEDEDNSTLTFHFLCLEKKLEWGSIMKIPLNEQILVVCSNDYNIGIIETSTGNLTEDELNFLLN